MKVLHILNELMYSGMEVMLSIAAPHFHSRGYESHILCTGQSEGPYAKVLAGRYKIAHIPFRRNILFLWRFFRFIKRERYDVVHIHPERAFFWYALLARSAGTKVIVRSVLDVFLFDGWLRYKRKVQRRIAGRLMKVTFWAIGESVLSVEKERYRNNCVLIRSWTDFELYSPVTAAERSEARKRYGILDGEYVLASIGTCNEKKNHMAVLRAIREICDLRPETDMMFLHRGTGPDTAEEQAAAERMRISARCRFIGYVSDIRSVLVASDVFVMTSHYEGLGSVILEAMSMGIPAILYDVYGMKDFLKNNRGGILVPSSGEGLSMALLSLAENPELMRKLGEEAREETLRYYSFRESMRRMTALYEGKRVLPGEWQVQENPDFIKDGSA